jgi:hypothetical protein
LCLFSRGWDPKEGPTNGEMHGNASPWGFKTTITAESVNGSPIFRLIHCAQIWKVAVEQITRIWTVVGVLQIPKGQTITVALGMCVCVINCLGTRNCCLCTTNTSISTVSGVGFDDLSYLSDHQEKENQKQITEFQELGAEFFREHFSDPTLVCWLMVKNHCDFYH